MAEPTNQTPHTTTRNHSDSQRREIQGRERDFRDDDVIASLANARENRRTRQVNEWERIGVRSIYRVA